MAVDKKYQWKLHKIKNGSSIQKPIYLHYLFGNLIKKEDKQKSKLNKNESRIKIKMELAENKKFKFNPETTIP